MEGIFAKFTYHPDMALKVLGYCDNLLNGLFMNEYIDSLIHIFLNDEHDNTRKELNEKILL